MDGPYGNFGIDDYFLERVADEQIDPNSEYWSLWIEPRVRETRAAARSGVLAGQEVLWAGDPVLGEHPAEAHRPGLAR